MSDESSSGGDSGRSVKYDLLLLDLFFFIQHFFGSFCSSVAFSHDGKVSGELGDARGGA